MLVPLDFNFAPEEDPTRVRVTLPRDAFLAEHIEEWRTADSERLQRMGRLVETEARQRGLDILAFYKSFRDGTDWGIHIRRVGILGVAHHLHSVSGLPVQRSIKAAYRLLFEHELFHFQVDCGYFKLETAGRPDLKIGDLPSAKGPYHVSRSVMTPWDPLEEALANARAIHRSKPEFKSAARDFLKGLPPGYRDFARFSKIKDFRNGLGAVFNLTSKSLERPALATGLGSVIDLDDRELNGLFVPVYLILD